MRTLKLSRRNKLSILFGLGLFVGCTIDYPKDSGLPSWNVILEIPIMETAVDLTTLMEDSLIDIIPYNSTGDSIFVFRDTMQIERVEVGERLKLDPIEDHFVQYASEVTVDSSGHSFSMTYDAVGIDDIHEAKRTTIGLIDLNNIQADTTAPFLFRDIMPNSNDIEAALIANGGSADIEIDSVELVQQTKTFSFDSFENIQVSSGFMNVTIINEMFIDLGAPIFVIFSNMTGDSLCSTRWDNEIPVGEAATNQVDLSGQTLPGQIQVSVQGYSNGSHGEIIEVNLSDLDSYFKIILEPDDILVSQADAIVPMQIIRDSSSILLVESENRVEEAQLQSGRLIINIDNTMEVTGSINLLIPSLRYGSAAGEIYSLPIPLALGSTDTSTALTDWVMVMALGDQRVYYEYTITTDDTDPESIVIAETDFVDIEISIVEITFNQVLGQIETQEINETGEIDVNSESLISEATIAAGKINILVDNRIGGEANVNITIPRLLRNSVQLDTTILVYPGQNAPVLINLQGYDIVMPLNDQRLNYLTHTTTLNSMVYEYDLKDSISVDIAVSELDFSYVKGFISQDAIVSDDVIVLENETKVQKAMIESGTMSLMITNYIGMVARVDISLPEFKLGGIALARQIDIGAQATTDTTVIDLSEYQLSLPLDDQTIHYSSVINIPADQETSLFLEDSVVIDVLIENLIFSEITGIINLVEVEIDPVEQMLTAFPDELQDIDFNHVDMIIDFETDIGVPVYLDLSITAFNQSGDTVTISVSSDNILVNSSVIIPGAENLININPDKILATGTARIGVAGVFGTVAADQYISGRMTVNAPLEFILSSEAKIDLEPSQISVEPPEELDRLVIYADMENQFDFGAQIEVLTAPDTSYFNSGSNSHPDTLFVLDIVPNSTQLDSIIIEENMSLLTDSVYVKPVVYLIGERIDGNPVPSRFLATDSLKILLYAAVKVLVDPN